MRVAYFWQERRGIFFNSIDFFFLSFHLVSKTSYNRGSRMNTFHEVYIILKIISDLLVRKIKETNRATFIWRNRQRDLRSLDHPGIPLAVNQQPTAYRWSFIGLVHMMTSLALQLLQMLDKRALGKTGKPRRHFSPFWPLLIGCPSKSKHQFSAFPTHRPLALQKSLSMNSSECLEGTSSSDNVP